VFSILAEDRRKHMAIFGKSGVGKTTLLRNMIAHDISAGLGVTVIDPHGSLIRDVLEMIPRSPGDFRSHQHPPQHLDDRLGAADRIHFVPCRPGPFGPASAGHAPGTTETPYQPVYRGQVLRSVSDPVVLSFFKTYENWNERFREEAIAPLLNKVSKFVANPLLRSVNWSDELEL
jgi:hypothetical protein